MDRRTMWLDQGLELLARAGAPGLRIDALASALGLTKGSFYHHFVDLADYRRALLGHFEEVHTTRFIRANDRLGDLSGVARLDALAADVLAGEDSSRGLEAAVRRWAADDDDARATMERIDGARVGYLEALFATVLDPTEAALRARMTYYLLIGSQHAAPPGSVAEVEAMWALILEPLREAVAR